MNICEKEIYLMFTKMEYNMEKSANLPKGTRHVKAGIKRPKYKHKNQLYQAPRKKGS
jgi:hypothetical protein